MSPISKAFSQASNTYIKEAYIQNLMAQRLIDLLMINAQDKIDNYSDILEIGCGPGNLSQLILLNLPKIRHIVLNDISLNMLEQCYLNLALTQQDQIKSSLLLGDINQLYLHNLTQLKIAHLDTKNKGEFKLIDFRLYKESDNANYDLIMANAVLQWLENIDEIIDFLLGKLKVRGALAFTLFAKGTFLELNNLTQRGLNYLEYESIQNLIERKARKYNCAYIVKSDGVIKQYFNNMRGLCQHLKLTGVNGIKKEALSIIQLRRILNTYEAQYRDENGIYLNWHPVYIVMHKK